MSGEAAPPQSGPGPDPRSADPSHLPLAGLRVLDFSRVLAGPLCTMVLADLGADVIKVESPSGDDTRGWGPPFVAGDATYFLSINRNKRSVVLNLKTEEGRAQATQLAQQADVVVQNFLPESARRLGVDAATLRKLNPDLVHCTIASFSGDAATQPGYDIIMQAVAGWMSLTGTIEGEPVKVGVAIVDVLTGLYAAIAILAAIHRRAEHGGAEITVSLFETGVAALVNQAANYLLGGLVPRPLGTQHPTIVPYQMFWASDGPFVLAIGNDRQFEKACSILERPELVDCYRTNSERVAGREELLRMLEEIFRTETLVHWCALFDSAELPCSPVRDLGDVFTSSQGRAVIEEVNDSLRGGLLRLVASPMHFADLTAPSSRTPPPCLGEHTDAILAHLHECGSWPAG